MKSNRYSALLFGSLVLSISFISCAPSLVNTEAPNGLVASPHNIVLSKLTDTMGVSLALRCGCTYRLYVTSVQGTNDNTAILYQATSRFDTLMTPQTLRVYPGTGVTHGKTYTAELAFYAPDDGGLKFYDTVHVTMNIP